MEVVVEDVDIGAGDGAADGGPGGVDGIGIDDSGGGDDGAFGGAVVVHEDEGESRGRAAMQGVGASEEYSQGRLGGPIRLEHLLGKDGRDEADGDLLGDEPIAQRGWRAAGDLIGEMEGGTGGEMRPDFPNGGVEPEAGDLAGAVGGGDGERGLMPVDQVG